MTKISFIKTTEEYTKVLFKYCFLLQNSDTSDHKQLDFLNALLSDFEEYSLVKYQNKSPEYILRKLNRQAC